MKFALDKEDKKEYNYKKQLHFSGGIYK